MCSSWKIQICLDVSTFWETLSICVEACAWAHMCSLTHFFVKKKICDHPHLLLSPPPVTLSRLPEVQEKKKKKDHCHFFSLVNETSIFLWLSICNPLRSKNRCSGLLWTCKAAEPNPKSGCDVLYVFGLMHILLAKRRYRHSPPI